MDKPGYKTTEFWLSNAAFALGALMASGALGSGVAAQVVGAGVALLAAMGYTYSRTKVKSLEE